MEQKTLRGLALLFIGNSHTYHHGVPDKVAALAAAEGFDPRVAQLTHGGWSLTKHLSEPEVLPNIRLGSYDYVILQERTHPFEERDAYLGGVAKLDAEIKKTGARTVIYMTWAPLDDPARQPSITSLQRESAEMAGAPLAEVGERLWRGEFPAREFFSDDGHHASDAGAAYDAKVIWETLKTDIGASERA